MKLKYSINKNDVSIGIRNVNINLYNHFFKTCLCDQIGFKSLKKDIIISAYNYSVMQLTKRYSDNYDVTAETIKRSSVGQFYDNNDNKLFFKNEIYDYDVLCLFLPLIYKSKFINYYCVSNINALTLCTFYKGDEKHYIQLVPNYCFLEYDNLFLKRAYNNITKESLVLISSTSNDDTLV